MKNWLTIGQFSKEVSLSPRTLRVYEDLGLLHAHTRGENKYRYYTSEQIELVERIKTFKSIGFSLEEIRSLLEIDISMDSERLKFLLQKQFCKLEHQQKNISSQKEQVETILSSLNGNKQGLSAQDRRFIMTQFEKISVVVAGVRDLEKTADFIREHVNKSGKDIPVTVWNGASPLPQKKPFILVIAEGLLPKPEVSKLSPDVVIIKELSQSSPAIHDAYLRLYGAVGPHMSTILNADDRAVIELAGNETIRQGRTFYFSKNSGLKAQISKIGGVVSDGEKIEVYGFNQNKGPLEIKLAKILGMDEEMALLASLAAVMDFGLNEDTLREISPG
jgi:DNA-binding transcriptional MerR regulator